MQDPVCHARIIGFCPASKVEAICITVARQKVVLEEG